MTEAQKSNRRLLTSIMSVGLTRRDIDSGYRKRKSKGPARRARRRVLRQQRTSWCSHFETIKKEGMSSV